LIEELLCYLKRFTEHFLSLLYPSFFHQFFTFFLIKLLGLLSPLIGHFLRLQLPPIKDQDYAYLIFPKKPDHLLEIVNMVLSWDSLMDLIGA